MTVDGAVSRQRHRAAHPVKTMQVAQCAAIQREVLGHIEGGLKGNLARHVAPQLALQFQRCAAVYRRAARRCAQRVVVGDGEFAVSDRGRPRVGVRARERERARVARRRALDQVARAADEAGVGGVRARPVLDGQGLAVGNGHLAAAGQRGDGLARGNREFGVVGRDTGQCDGRTVVNRALVGGRFSGDIGQHQLARVDAGRARVGVRARKRGLAAAGLGQAARARAAGRADAPADGDFRGRAGSEARKYCRG